MPFSKTQIDRLGDRLKTGGHTDSDLRLLDDYRRSFGEAYEAVLQIIRQRGQLPTGRLAKSTVSIVEKLRRESIRLSQIQDIAGCRVVVPNVVEQDRFVASFRTEFPDLSAVDRRQNPSYGYRAVHLVAGVEGKSIEIQVRSSLQHLWAEVSEKSSDILDPTIKYGGGTITWRNFLVSSSVSVATYERFEIAYFQAATSKEAAEVAHENFRKIVSDMPKHSVTDAKMLDLQEKLEDSTRRIEDVKQKHQGLQERLEHSRTANVVLLTKAIESLNELKRRKQ